MPLYKEKQPIYKIYRIGDSQPVWIEKSQTRQINENTWHSGKFKFIFLSEAEKTKIIKSTGSMPYCLLVMGAERHYARKGDYILKDQFGNFRFCSQLHFDACFEEIPEEESD